MVVYHVDKIYFFPIAIVKLNAIIISILKQDKVIFVKIVIQIVKLVHFHQLIAQIAGRIIK